MPLILLVVTASLGLALPAVRPAAAETVFAGYRGSSVTLDLFLDPEGRVLECLARGEALSDEARARICERAIGRDFHEGARGLDGEPVHGETNLTRITRSDYESRRSPPQPAPEADFEIMVSAMPGGRNRHRVSLVVLVDEQGRVLRCSHSGEDDGQFATIACSQSTAHRFAIRQGADGTAVPYVAALQIDFVREPAGNP